jgi:hypothetical protein
MPKRNSSKPKNKSRPKGQNSYPRDGSSFSRPRIEHLSTAGSLRVVKTATSGGSIDIIGGSGFNNIGSSFSVTPVIGMFFSQAGFYVYNTVIGPAAFAFFPYTGAGNYTAIYDQWRIDKVRLRAYFSNNFSGVNTVSSSIPLFYSCIDYDGSNLPPGNVQAVLSYENSCVHQTPTTGIPVIDRTFVPRVVNNLTGNLVVSNAYGLMPERSWIDSASSSTPHWGMFVGFDPQGATATTATGYITFIAEIEYEYRGDRS